MIKIIILILAAMNIFAPRVIHVFQHDKQLIKIGETTSNEPFGVTILSNMIKMFNENTNQKNFTEKIEEFTKHWDNFYVGSNPTIAVDMVIIYFVACLDQYLEIKIHYDKKPTYSNIIDMTILGTSVDKKLQNFVLNFLSSQLIGGWKLYKKTLQRDLRVIAEMVAFVLKNQR